MEQTATTKNIFLITNLAQLKIYERAMLLIASAERAHALHDKPALYKAGASLMSLGPNCEAIGLYYYSLYLVRLGKRNQAESLLSQIVSTGPDLFKRKSLITLGGNKFDDHNYSEAAGFFREAGRIKSADLTSELRRGKMLAVLKSVDGDHQGALADLKKLYPGVQAVSLQHPVLYYDYLNSLAVELGEVGRVEEAQNASRIALASPYASAYPEWRETGDELTMRGRRPSHTFVGFNAQFNQWTSDTANVVALPVSRNSNSAEPVKAGYNPFQQPARIIDFQAWKRTMKKEPNDTPKTEKAKSEMTTREKLLKIIGLISEKDLTDDQLERMLEAVEGIAQESKNTNRQ